MPGEEALLLAEVRHRQVIAGHEIAHHLAQRGHVVLGFADVIVPREPVAGQIVTQCHQWPLVEKAGLIERAVEKDLLLADADEQLGVFVRGFRGGRDRCCVAQRIPRATEHGIGICT